MSQPFPDLDLEEDPDASLTAASQVVAVVKNFSSISDMSVFSSYEESIALISECMTMWSLLRRDEAMDDISAGVASLVEPPLGSRSQASGAERSEARGRLPQDASSGFPRIS